MRWVQKQSSYRGKECEGGRILWGGMRDFFGLDYAVR